MSKVRLGLALCSSYCTFDKVLPIAKILSDTYDLTIIMSENAANRDTRFGKAEDFKKELRDISGKEIITTIEGAEPIGPRKLLDLIAVAPCTGNTIAKLANGIADSSVTLAVKAHLRNLRPVVVAISSNDSLGANAKNIGELINRKHYYFVPFRQDSPSKKPSSVISDYTLLPDTIEYALKSEQIQPLLLAPKE